jgi:primosomal protein N'
MAKCYKCKVNFTNISETKIYTCKYCLAEEESPEDIDEELETLLNPTGRTKVQIEEEQNIC